MRLQALILCALAACGDDAFHIGSLPHVVPHTGRVLSTVNLVTITYDDDPLGDLADRFGASVLATHWLHATGDEYGVRGGAQLATYHMGPAPAHLTYGEVSKIPSQLIAAGAVPGPTDHGVPILYAIYVPATTSITADDGTGAMCQTALAYHDSDGTVPFAVIPTCYPGSELARTMFSSHEIIEAATDPFLDAFYVDPPDPNDPYHYSGAEVADLCNRVPAPSEDGFALEASWSNAQADAWEVHPCQPVAPGDVYTMTIVDPQTVVDASPGETVTWQLTGYASGPTDDWTLYSRHGYAGDSSTYNDELAHSLVFDPPTINDGRVSTATGVVPLDAPAGTIVAANVWSRDTWNLVAVRVR